MSNEVFNRVEKKFLINKKQANKLLPSLNSILDVDEHSNTKGYLIQNLYYDTEDDYLIKHSLSKPMFKEKLRLRAYGNVNLESFVYIELKKKINGVVNKRRSCMKLCEAYVFLNTKEMPEIKEYHNKQVLKEIHFFINKYDLKAATYISYERIAYKKDDFRVTIDRNINTRKDFLRLEYTSNSTSLLDKDYMLLEAKSTLGLPIWFVEELSRLKIYKTSFSKYGKDYVRRKEIIKEKGINVCLNQSSVTQQIQQSY